MRAKCLNVDKPDNGSKDTEVVVGGFYVVIEANVQSIASPEPFISIVGHSGEEVQRPKRNFKILG